MDEIVDAAMQVDPVGEGQILEHAATLLMTAAGMERAAGCPTCGTSRLPDCDYCEGTGYDIENDDAPATLLAARLLRQTVLERVAAAGHDRCLSCSSEVQLAWMESDEWGASRYCGPCLNGPLD